MLKTWATVETDPAKRTFAGLQRGPDGRFADADLARILQDATEQAAGAFRARGSPAALRVVEMLGMAQARGWGVCTMNEFRAFLGLRRFGSFEEWNSDPEIAVSFVCWVLACMHECEARGTDVGDGNDWTVLL